MKVLVKFASGLDRIQDAPDWVRDCGVFRTARPDDPIHGVNVVYVGDWGQKPVPVFVQETMLQEDAKEND